MSTPAPAASLSSILFPPSVAILLLMPPLLPPVQRSNRKTGIYFYSKRGLWKKAHPLSQPAADSSPRGGAERFARRCTLRGTKGRVRHGVLPMYTEPPGRRRPLRHTYMPLQLPIYLCCPTLYKTISSVPAPMRTQPRTDLAVTFSWRKTKARIRVMTTLNLSTGTTLDASPICSAL